MSAGNGRILLPPPPGAPGTVVRALDDQALEVLSQGTPGILRPGVLPWALMGQWRWVQYQPNLWWRSQDPQRWTWERVAPVTWPQLLAGTGGVQVVGFQCWRCWRQSRSSADGVHGYCGKCGYV